MRKEVAVVLSALAASYPRKTLLALWAELRSLDKEEFEKLLQSNGPAAAKSKKPRRTTPPTEVVPEDTPEARIGHMLLGRAGMDDISAIGELRTQLVRQGVDPSNIPAPQGRNVHAWLPI